MFLAFYPLCILIIWTIAIHPVRLPLHHRPRLPQNRLLPVLLTPLPSVCQPLQDPPSRPISHTMDAYAKAAALFTCVEVKCPSGNLQKDEHLDGGQSVQKSRASIVSLCD
jgi:hypothetical protein